MAIKVAHCIGYQTLTVGEAVAVGDATVQQNRLDATLAGPDVLIADSSCTAAEYPAKIGWGHGAPEIVLASERLEFLL